MENKKVKITLELDGNDCIIIGQLISQAEDYSNNTWVTKNDVISGLLNFYKNAKLIDYHEQYKKDIASYIGNRVTNK